MVREHRLFGTDGIRGEVNKYPIVPELMLKLGKVVASLYGKVLIGKDNRSSSDMLESAIVSGALSVGAEVECVGCIPTPALSFLAKSSGMVALMVSASHNHCYDNGVKFFDQSGSKFSVASELEIEKLLISDSVPDSAPPSEVRRVLNKNGDRDKYLQFVISRIGLLGYPIRSGIKVVFDCANGAMTPLLDFICETLLDNCCLVSTENDGLTVNHCSGVMHPSNIREHVLRKKADLGIAFDADGDRVIICDERGDIVDGDQVLALLASNMLANNQLSSKSVIATTMSNIRLEEFLHSLGLALHRTDVGDRFVSRRMHELGANLGGEKSGHIVLSDFNNCSDGFIAALKIIAVWAHSGHLASHAFKMFEPVPQMLVNIYSNDENVLGRRSVQLIVDEIYKRLGDEGRMVLRKSGTESGVIRVMLESKNLDNYAYLLRALEAEFAQHV